MTDQNPATQSAGAGKEDLSDLDARLKQIVKSLPATVVYNPLMTVLALIPGWGSPWRPDPRGSPRCCR